MDFGLLLPKFMLALLGFLIILLPSLVFHLTSYGRIFTFKSLVNSTTISLFVTFWFLIISSIIGTFYSLPLFILIIVIIYYLGKSEAFKIDRTIERSNLFEISLILLSTFSWYFLLISPQLDSFKNLIHFIYSFDGHQLYEIFYGFSDVDDSIYSYISWGEILSHSHYLPDYSLNSQFYAIPYISGGYVLIGYIFGFFGYSGIYAIAGISIYFIFITQLIIVSWLDENGLKNYYWMAIGILFAAPYFFVLQTGVNREIYIIPMILMIFYNIFMYNKDKSSKNYIYILLSMMLLASIRETMLILIAAIFLSYLVVFGYSNIKSTYFQVDKLKLLIIFLPIIGWYVRNFYFYMNPAYPQFQSIFGNDLVVMQTQMTSEFSNYISYLLASGTQNNIQFLYPSLFLGIVYLLKSSSRYKFNRFVLFSICIYIIMFMSLTPFYFEPRYYVYIFNGLLVYFSTLFVIEIFIRTNIGKYFTGISLNHILFIVIIFLLMNIIGIGMLYSTPTYVAERGVPDMWILDDSIPDDTILIMNSDNVYENDMQTDMPGITQTRSIPLANFAYHMFMLGTMDDDSITKTLQNNNISHIVYIHYPNESFEETVLRNNSIKNSRSIIDDTKFDNSFVYNYILRQSKYESSINLTKNKIASIYYIRS